MSRQRFQSFRYSYPIASVNPVFSVDTNKQLELSNMALVNASASSMSLGLGVSLNSSNALLYAYTSATTSAVLQSSASKNLFTTTNNDGFVIQTSYAPCDFIAFNISQASTGSPVYEYSYWNGSAFVAITPIVSPTYSATGVSYLVIAAPYDWVKGAGGITGLSTNMFTLRVRATTAPGTSVISSANTIARFIAYRELIPSRQALSVTCEPGQYLLNQGEGLIPYFSAVNANNVVELAIKVNP